MVRLPEPVDLDAILQCDFYRLRRARLVEKSEDVPLVHRPDYARAVNVAGEHDANSVRMCLVQVGEKFDPILRWHMKIADYYGAPVFLKNCHSFIGAGCAMD
jgi:hypothetical protein